jgi:hypothetical protein
MRLSCKNSLLFLVVMTMVMPSFAFSGGSAPEETHSNDAASVACSEPRPQMCTMDYRPVCAQLENGQLKTYSNGCTACSDTKISSYRDGACEEEK